MPVYRRTEAKYYSATFGATLSVMRSIENLNTTLASLYGGDNIETLFRHYYYKTQIFASKPCRVELVVILAQNGATFTATDGDPLTNTEGTDWDAAIDKPFEIYHVANLDTSSLVYQAKHGADAVAVYYSKPVVANLMPVITKLARQVESSSRTDPIQAFFGYRAIGISTGETVDLRMIKSIGFNSVPRRPVFS